MRLFGSYFRVAFFGDCFLHANGSEFVYREPNLTKIVEVRDRVFTMLKQRGMVRLL